jgi:hypothetical protein
MAVDIYVASRYIGLSIESDATGEYPEITGGER